MRAGLTVALLTIMLSGEIPIEMLSVVMEDLRAVAVKAGCPANRVRAEVRWQGAGKPAELLIRCAEELVVPAVETSPSP